MMPFFFAFAAFVSFFPVIAGALYVLSLLVGFITFSWTLVLYITLLPTIVIGMGAMNNW